MSVYGGGFAPPGGSSSSAARPALPTSTVELSVRCTDLADMDVFSKSDPICVLFVQSHGRWVEFGRTEMLKDTLNPAWQHKFVIEYSFEERQMLKFEFYDWDVQSNRLEDHDFLGRIECPLGSIVSSNGGEYVAVPKDVPRQQKKTKVYVTAEELKANKEHARIQLAAEKLDKKDFFGKSDPFFILHKKMPNGQWAVVYRSEEIMRNLNPTWKPLDISLRDLCNGDYERELKIDVYDWDSDGGHDFIGSFTTNLRALSTAQIEQTRFPCINQKKKQKKSSYKNSGTVYVKSILIETRPSFVDYIQGGTAMNFSVAVDFTASNGDPNHPASLHYRGYGDNQYTLAIRSVGDIIQDYDTDKQFPALGFGARVPPSFTVSHEFYLNLRPDNPYCQGVDGLLAAYHNSLQNVQLYGPTNFSPVINHVAKFAQAYQDGRQYFVLLIITDGIITDMENTMRSIISASSLPMSIIIVGVGQEDFSAMEALDSDNRLLSYGGRTAKRDIVQFVEMRKFIAPNGTWNKEMLAKEVLAEIPNQVVGWMQSKGIKPVPQPS